MKIIFAIAEIKRIPKAVVALGVFDGVHRAHRQILKYAVREARRIKGKSVVVTFWPHPQQEASLYSLKHRLRLIEEIGIDICIVINFSRSFAKISAENFVRNILVNKIGAQYVCFGENFRFGKGAKGDINLLKKLALRYRFRLKVFEVIKVKHKPISSTYIRRAIIGGDLKTAGALLLRPVGVLGTVIRGSSLAKRLGFPTANINPHHEVLPPSGVYAVKIIFQNKKFKGACYIGSKPTVQFKVPSSESKAPIHIEVHIFNFQGDIYGKDLELQFIKKIRNEKKFSSAVILATQVRKDVSLVKKLLSSH
jgi:riboflavin kinase/FMN adenylyltransferase